MANNQETASKEKEHDADVDEIDPCSNCGKTEKGHYDESMDNQICECCYKYFCRECKEKGLIKLAPEFKEPMLVCTYKTRDSKYAVQPVNMCCVKCIEKATKYWQTRRATEEKHHPCCECTKPITLEAFHDGCALCDICLSPFCPDCKNVYPIDQPADDAVYVCSVCAAEKDAEIRDRKKKEEDEDDEDDEEERVKEPPRKKVKKNEQKKEEEEMKKD